MGYYGYNVWPRFALAILIKHTSLVYDVRDKKKEKRV